MMELTKYDRGKKSIFFVDDEKFRVLIDEDI